MATTNQAYAASVILEAFRTRLVNVLELDSHFVRLVANDAYEVSHEETLIAIRPLGPKPLTDAGGGRRARPVTRSVRVYVHKRSSSDFAGDDRLIVTALCDLEDRVFDALDDYWLRDDSRTNYLTIEPIHLTDASGGPPVRQATNDVGEVFSRLDFELVYLLANNTPEPTTT